MNISGADQIPEKCLKNGIDLDYLSNLQNLLQLVCCFGTLLSVTHLIFVEFIDRTTYLVKL